MEKWVGHVAFVTGTSSGIGEAIAIQLVENGLKVIGFARRQHLLDELAVKLSSKKGKFYPYPGDVTKEEDLLKAFQWTKSTVGPVSIIINNAALMSMAKLSESDTKLWEQLLDINVLAPCIATREAIKHMKESKIDGHVININSIAGHKIIGKPLLNLYSSTKYALTALTETLRLELAQEGSKIRVTSLSPGGVRTEIAKSSMDRLKLPVDSALSFNLLEPIDIANAVLYVLGTPPTVNITELTIQAVGEHAYS